MEDDGQHRTATQSIVNERRIERFLRSSRCVAGQLRNVSVETLGCVVVVVAVVVTWGNGVEEVEETRFCKPWPV